MISFYERRSAWGSSDHYYGKYKIPSTNDTSRTKWDKIIEFLPYDNRSSWSGRGSFVWERVESTVNKWNPTIQDMLQNETSLQLKRAVPIKVTDNIPEPFNIAVPENIFQLILMMNIPLISKTMRGIEFVDNNYTELAEQFQTSNHLVSQNEINKFKTFIDELWKDIFYSSVLDHIWNIEEDVLGAYYFLIPEIHMHWMVIGVMSSFHDIPIEAITIVTLAHELAHVYMHLGRDDDGKYWDTEALAATDFTVVESIAHYYTETISKKLSLQIPEIESACRELYGEDKFRRSWSVMLGDNSLDSEVVRACIIECRSRGEILEYQFQRILDRQRMIVPQHHRK